MATEQAQQAPAQGVQQRYNQAIEGLGAMVQELQSDLQHAAADAEYWRQEAETFRRKYQEEKARSERLRRIVSVVQAPAAAGGLPGACLGLGRSPYSSFTAAGRRGSLPEPRSHPPGAQALPACADAAADAAAAAGGSASHDGAVGRGAAAPPPLLAPQGSAPLPGEAGPRAIRRTVTVPRPGVPAALQAAGLAGSFASVLSGIDSPKRRRQTVESLVHMMMAYTVAQGVAGADDDAEEPLSSISIDDDEGSSGVGLAAAAAAAAAMARAWARAASKEQRDVNGAAGSGGGAAGAAAGGKAGFRLVATVTNKMGKRRQSQANLSTSASQDSLLEGTSPNSSTQSLQILAAKAAAAAGAGAPDAPPPPPLALGGREGAGPLMAAVAAGQAGGLSALFGSGGGGGGGGGGAKGSALPPAGPSAPAARGGGPAVAAASLQPEAPDGGADGAAAPAAGGGPGGAAAAAASSSGPAAGPGPAAQGSQIALHWLSRPRNVLVMRKLAISTEGAFQAAVDWLMEHHINVYVEPGVYADMAAARKQQQAEARQAAEAQQQGAGGGGASSSSSSTGGKGGGGGGGGPASPEGRVELHPPGAGFHGAWGGGRRDGGAEGPGRPAGAGDGAAAAAASGPTVTFADAAPLSPPARRADRPPGELRTWEVEPGAPGDYLPLWLSNQLDFVVVFGGDGTVLWTCHMFGNRSVPPVVPFNLGSLGFLTPFEPTAARRVLGRVVRGGFPIQLRHRLHCTIVRSSALLPSGAPAPPPAAAGGMPSLPAGLLAFAEGAECPEGVCLESEERVVLNEVVLDRGISPYLTNLETYCDGNFVTNVQGDGLIVATPTGSTAYSLAAGGSMVHPQVPCVLFTPICPHSLSFRPLMFPDHVVLCIRVPPGIRSQVWCSFDGKERTELHPGDAVLIRLSKWPLPTVTNASDSSTDWFVSVRQNLGWNARKVQAGAGQ